MQKNKKRNLVQLTQIEHSNFEIPFQMASTFMVSYNVAVIMSVTPKSVSLRQFNR